jgi:23S rRNA G2445 N2-methylase RlmL
MDNSLNYQNTWVKPQYIATTLFGLENILAGELVELGAEDILTMNRAVGFSGSQAIMYKVNIGARTAMRILKNMDLMHLSVH